jgi:hypothetical protein
MKNFKQLITSSKFTFIFAAALSMAASSSIALAQIYKVTPVTRGGGFPDQATFEAFLQSFEDQINSNLPSVETGEYTKGMANASAMATTGTSNVYGSKFSKGLFGVSGSLGVDLGEGNSISDFDTKKVAGFGAQASAVLGFNPAVISDSPWGPIDPSKLRFYLSFLKMDREFQDADISFTNFGIVGQYRIIDERSLGMSALRWNGVDVTTGFRIAKMKGSFTQTITESFEDPDVPGVTANLSGPALIGADVNIFSIPVEASTSVRVAYFLNFIGGAGLDFNFGSSESIANFNSDIVFTDGSDATGELDLGTKAKPTMLNARVFAGLGLDVAIGTLNFVLGKSLTAAAWNLNAGLNVFW